MFGDSYTIVPITSPSGLDVGYISSNPSVVRVDSNGNVVAVGEGTALISLSVGDDVVYVNSTTVGVTITKIPTEIK